MSQPPAAAAGECRPPREKKDLLVRIKGAECESLTRRYKRALRQLYLLQNQASLHDDVSARLASQIQAHIAKLPIESQSSKSAPPRKRPSAGSSSPAKSAKQRLVQRLQKSHSPPRSSHPKSESDRALKQESFQRFRSSTILVNSDARSGQSVKPEMTHQEEEESESEDELLALTTTQDENRCPVDLAGESGVISRVLALRNEGLLSLKRLPKIHEPERALSHWDYVLKEMKWMETDFYQEKLWKVNAARVLSQSAKRFLSVVSADPDESALPPLFLTARLRTRKVAAAVSRFWAAATDLLDIRNNLLQQEQDSSRLSLENSQHARGFECVTNSAAISADKSLSRLNSADVDVRLIPPEVKEPSTEEAGVKNESDSSHLDLGIDVEEIEKEVGMKMDDIFNGSFPSDPDKAPDSFVNGGGESWPLTPGEHVIELEEQFLAVEKFAVSLVESTLYDIPEHDIDRDSYEDMLTLDRCCMECEYTCVSGDASFFTYMPPTPPIDDHDVYVDESVFYLYKRQVMKDSQLPPLAPPVARKSATGAPDEKRPKLEPGSSAVAPLHKHTVSRADIAVPPRCLFDRPSAVHPKIRLDIKERKANGCIIPRPHLKSIYLPVKQKPLVHFAIGPDKTVEWLPNEDWQIVFSLLCVLELPTDLAAVTPAVVTNWDFAHNMVNMISRTHRSPKQVRSRYDSYLKPCEEGRTFMTEFKKKQKQQMSKFGNNQNATNAAGGAQAQETTWGKPTKLPKTHQLMSQDMNNSITASFSSKFDLISSCIMRKRIHPSTPMAPPAMIQPTMKNQRHASAFEKKEIAYDEPLSPLFLSEQRALRLKSEKRGQASSGASSPLTPIGSKPIIGPEAALFNPGKTRVGPPPGGLPGSRPIPPQGSYMPGAKHDLEGLASAGAMQAGALARQRSQPRYPTPGMARNPPVNNQQQPQHQSSIRILQAGDLITSQKPTAESRGILQNRPDPTKRFTAPSQYQVQAVRQNPMGMGVPQGSGLVPNRQMPPGMDFSQKVALSQQLTSSSSAARHLGMRPQQQQQQQQSNSYAGFQLRSVSQGNPMTSAVGGGGPRSAGPRSATQLLHLRQPGSGNPPAGAAQPRQRFSQVVSSAPTGMRTSSPVIVHHQYSGVMSQSQQPRNMSPGSQQVRRPSPYMAYQSGERAPSASSAVAQVVHAVSQQHQANQIAATSSNQNAPGGAPQNSQ